jgi:hypothetical protein
MRLFPFHEIHTITDNIIPLPEKRLSLSTQFSMRRPHHLKTDCESSDAEESYVIVKEIISRHSHAYWPERFSNGSQVASLKA